MILGTIGVGIVEDDGDSVAGCLAQLDVAVGYPQYIGSYQVTRYQTFAFNDVVVDNKDVRETILDYISAINDELEYKRAELGLPYITD